MGPVSKQKLSPIINRSARLVNLALKRNAETAGIESKSKEKHSSESSSQFCEIGDKANVVDDSENHKRARKKVTRWLDFYTDMPKRRRLASASNRLNIRAMISHSTSQSQAVNESHVIKSDVTLNTVGDIETVSHLTSQSQAVNESHVISSDVTLNTVGALETVSHLTSKSQAMNESHINSDVTLNTVGALETVSHLTSQSQAVNESHVIKSDVTLNTVGDIETVSHLTSQSQAMNESHINSDVTLNTVGAFEAVSHLTSQSQVTNESHINSDVTLNTVGALEAVSHLTSQSQAINESHISSDNMFNNSMLVIDENGNEYAFEDPSAYDITTTDVAVLLQCIQTDNCINGIASDFIMSPSAFEPYTEVDYSQVFSSRLLINPISGLLESEHENNEADQPTADRHLVNPVTGEVEVDIDAASVIIPSNDTPIKKTRKRKRIAAKWKRNVRKALRNCGEEYINIAGNKVLKRELKPLAKNHTCRMQCSMNISEPERMQIFQNFWKMGDYNKQNIYIAGCIKEKPVSFHRTGCAVPDSPVHPVVNSDNSTDGSKQKRSRIRRKSCTKQFSREFSLQTSTNTVRVCKVTFLNTFGVSDGRLHRILKMQRSNSGIARDDLRGKNKKQKTDEKQIEFIKKHILSFPANMSHYTRSHSSNRLYLASNLSISKMYELYLELCAKEGISPAKIWLYRHVFNTEFNFSFQLPRKDTCKKCDIYKIKAEVEINEEAKSILITEHDIHLRKAELAREQLKKSKQNNDSKSETFTFDLQKVFSVPHLTTNETYYCRQLSVFNLGIHNTTTSKVVMNVWPESVASRGAEEIGSCLLNYCCERAADGIEQITAYSDACGGQNRNSKIVAMWMYITQTTLIHEVNHKFMVSGHSYLPNDSDFGVIERKVKRSSQLYVPSDWYTTIATCNKKNPFKVNEMNCESMKSIAPVMNLLTIRKIDCAKNKVEWLKIQWIQILKKEPRKMFYKYTLQEDVPFSCVNFAKTSKSGQKDMSQIVLGKLYENPRVISHEKFKDISKLLKYVPPVHHSFYETLSHAISDTAEIHLNEDELLNTSENEEEEPSVEKDYDNLDRRETIPNSAVSLEQSSSRQKVSIKTVPRATERSKKSSGTLVKNKRNYRRST